MKTELTELIKKYHTNLSEHRVNGLVEEVLALMPTPLKLSEFQSGSTFKYKGYEFTKLADEEDSCYCLLNGTVFKSPFGETNDWAKSPIRKCLNAFDENGNSMTIKGINESDLLSVSLNYSAYKIPNGRTEDRITVLSYEEYWAYNFPSVDKWTWLRSGRNNAANLAYALNTSGGTGSYYVNYPYAVRPALHFRKDLEVEE